MRLPPTPSQCHRFRGSEIFSELPSRATISCRTPPPPPKLRRAVLVRIRENGSDTSSRADRRDKIREIAKRGSSPEQNRAPEISRGLLRRFPAILEILDRRFHLV